MQLTLPRAVDIILKLHQQEIIMDKKYQGKQVTVVRDARQGDDGFDAAKTPQTLISIPNGAQPSTNKVVLTSELSPA